MIKFQYIIHKETGTVIKYEDWKEAAIIDNFITINKEKKVFINPKNIFKAKEMLFSDDFEIIYNSEFTYEEIQDLFRATNSKTIGKKLYKIMNDREFYKSKYGIDI